MYKKTNQALFWCVFYHTLLSDESYEEITRNQSVLKNILISPIKKNEFFFFYFENFEIAHKAKKD